MQLPSFAKVLQRLREGERMDDQAFDMRLFQQAERIKARYDICYDPENPVPTDAELADRCFGAAREPQFVPPPFR